MAEAVQRAWAYDVMACYAKARAREANGKGTMPMGMPRIYSTKRYR